MTHTARALSLTFALLLAAARAQAADSVPMQAGETVWLDVPGARGWSVADPAIVELRRETNGRYSLRGKASGKTVLQAKTSRGVLWVFVSVVEHDGAAAARDASPAASRSGAVTAAASRGPLAPGSRPLGHAAL